MATIDLNNLIRPKKTNYSTPDLTKQVQNPLPVYTDLHLDLITAKSIGLGDKAVNSTDILVDNDTQAIKNSIKNIFTTRKGQKILSPEFGSSLEQYLFEAVSELGANAIGNDIYNAISKYEPRVTVVQVYVQPNPESTFNTQLQGNTLTTILPKRNINYNPSSNYGAGYGITVIYEINDIKKQDNLTLLAQLGGQIIF